MKYRSRVHTPPQVFFYWYLFCCRTVVKRPGRHNSYYCRVGWYCPYVGRRGGVCCKTLDAAKSVNHI